jgi:ATP-dependent DNA helicase RecG
MTTHTELLEIINNGENSGVEFKRDELQSLDLAKELVAFSNFSGGMVLLGVDDGRSVFGVTRPDIEQFVMNTCRDKIRDDSRCRTGKGYRGCAGNTRIGCSQRMAP